MTLRPSFADFCFDRLKIKTSERTNRESVSQSVNLSLIYYSIDRSVDGWGKNKGKKRLWVRNAASEWRAAGSHAKNCKLDWAPLRVRRGIYVWVIFIAYHRHLIAKSRMAWPLLKSLNFQNRNRRQLLIPCNYFLHDAENSFSLRMLFWPNTNFLYPSGYQYDPRLITNQRQPQQPLDRHIWIHQQQHTERVNRKTNTL